MKLLPRILAVLAIIVVTGTAQAEKAFYAVPLRGLKLAEGELPKSTDRPTRSHWMDRTALVPRVVVDGGAEAFLSYQNDSYSPWTPLKGLFDGMTIHAEGPQGKDITGHVYLPHPSEHKMVSLRFAIPATDADPKNEDTFLKAKESHYQNLRDRNIPGTAWFRHQQRSVRHKSADSETPPVQQGDNWRQQNELNRTYALFTGGRAISENLQLDRTLDLRGEKIEKVPLDSIRGITTDPIDWDALVKGLDPKTDHLAKYVPADQHVLFFPSFAAAMRVANETTKYGTPILRMVEPRAEDAQTKSRYERQLGCRLSSVSRLLGPHLVKSIALTGSDPYYRTGTDVAVLFETDRPEVLSKLLAAQVAMVASGVPGAKVSTGKEGDLEYHLIRSPDRTICSYLAVLDDAVVLTNSSHQLHQLAEVRAKRLPAINSTPEYRFFRNRYRLGDPNETALLVITDATIRRWCGPRWRIATSRRTHDAAMLAELQALEVDTFAKNDTPSGTVHTTLPIGDEGQLTLTPSGVLSSTRGSLRFLTPIAEIPMTEVTKAESEAYERWRDGYEQYWNVGFDPIAFRLTIDNKQLAGDMTVMPLISATQYRDMIDLSAGGEIKPGSGDPHDALVQFVLAINKESRHFRSADSLTSSMRTGLSFGWVGDSVSVYLDKEGSFWKDLAAISGDDKSRDDFMEKNAHRVPVGLNVEVANGFQLAGFLAAGRAWLDQTVPDMLQWETVKHGDDTYVKVSVSPQKRGRALVPDEWKIFYSASGDGLIVSPDENVLLRALARQKARAKNLEQTTADAAVDKTSSPSPQPWLGKNVALRADRKFLDVINALSAQQYQRAMQEAAWNNLPILNEWRQLYPDVDPVKLHERVWGIRLVCPGGGRYVWNDQWQTMESTVYGHPGEPKKGPAVPTVLGQFSAADFGLTFENNGLRAKVRLDREKKGDSK